jgi:hypothetical protein
MSESSLETVHRLEKEIEDIHRREKNPSSMMS